MLYALIRSVQPSEPQSLKSKSDRTESTLTCPKGRTSSLDSQSIGPKRPKIEPAQQTSLDLVAQTSSSCERQDDDYRENFFSKLKGKQKQKD